MPTTATATSNPPPSTFNALFKSLTSSPTLQTLMTPLLFISFLFSLLIIDRQTSDAVLPRRPQSSSSSSSSPAEKDQHNYYHSHQKKLAKVEVDEAFAIRGRVMAAICVSAAVGIVGVAWCISKLWEGWGGRILS